MWHCLSLEILPRGAPAFPWGSPTAFPRARAWRRRAGFGKLAKKRVNTANRYARHLFMSVGFSTSFMKHGSRHSCLIPAGLVFAAHISCMTCRPRQRPSVRSSYLHSGLQSSLSCLLHTGVLSVFSSAFAPQHSVIFSEAKDTEKASPCH